MLDLPSEEKSPTKLNKKVKGPDSGLEDELSESNDA